MAFGRVEEIILLLTLMGASIGAASFVGWLCLGPINRLAGRLRARTRFQLSDFFWLLIHAQLALTYCVRFIGREQRFFPVMLGFLTLAVSGMWAGSLSCLSRAGVTDPLRRAIFVLFMVPLTLTLMMTSAIGLIVIGGMWLSPGFDPTLPMQFGDATVFIPYHPYSTTIAVVCVPLVGLAVRRVSSWIVRDPSVREALTREALARESLARETLARESLARNSASPAQVRDPLASPRSGSP
jgi:hypothetical protein